MAENVFTNPEVFRIMNEEFVFVALYGDDKTVLPEEFWVTLPNGRVRRQMGQVNSDFVAERYGAAAQPTYIITDAEGNMLLPHVGYTPSIPSFLDYLNRGLRAFRERR
jgi:thiol:disulfide interchange protein DsbD